MIATDALSLMFFACFLVGLVYFIVTALLGNLGHSAMHTGTHHAPAGVGHANTHAGAHTITQAHNAGKVEAGNQHASALGFLNPTSLMLFLLGFGFFGYLFHNFISFETPILALIIAAIGGIVVAGLLLLAITRLFGNSEGATVQDISDRTGLLGKVSLTIQENGIGEVLYVSPGGMRKSVPARSIDGRRMEREQEVVVVNYRDGVAEVDTWDHFIHEEGNYDDVPGRTATDSLDQLRTLLDQAGNTDKSDPQPLVIRNDAQME